MHFAQFVAEHIASSTAMQVAYASRMAKPAYTGPRFQRRKHWLNVLVSQAGGPKVVGDAIETPDTHITAMCKGNRGVGDAMADRLEARFGKPDGWMDQAVEAVQLPPATDAASLLAWGEALLAAPPANRKSAAEMLGTFFSDPDLNRDLIPVIVKRLSGESTDQKVQSTGTDG